MNSFTRMTIAIVIALLIPVVPFAVVGELPGDRWLHGIADEGWLFGLASAALLASDTLLPIPSSIIGTLLGGRLGFLPGLTWCWLGLMLGSATAYGVGYVFLRQFATRLPETPSLLVLFASRAVPVLAEALADSRFPVGSPWRIHFHVPVQAETLQGGMLATTRRDILDVLDFLKDNPACRPHLEVETYTWEVLPVDMRPQGPDELNAGLAAELSWLQDQMRQRGLIREQAA